MTFKERFLSGNSWLLRLVRKIGFYLIDLDVHLSPYTYGLNTRERQQKIIVSLTSYPARFDGLPLPLNSLLHQTVKPDKIIVYLGSDTKETDITPKMRTFEKYGVEYRIDDTKNLKPHKKYFYVLREFPDDLVITVDDDILYPRTLISSLIKTYRKYPDALCARRVHKITRAENGKIAPYDTWHIQYRKCLTPDTDLFSTNGAGTLFAPGMLDARALDAALIEKYCLNADDVWLWYMARLAGTKIVWAPCISLSPPSVRETKKKPSLQDFNVVGGGNTLYLQQMAEAFGDL